jgi:hypothetical protein
MEDNPLKIKCYGKKRTFDSLKNNFVVIVRQNGQKILKYFPQKENIS